MAVLKNPFEIGRNEKFLHEPAAGHGIFDFVANKGAIVLLGKSVFVHPERVGTSGLAIDEAMGRLPDLDLALPAQRYAPQAQAIVEQRALADFDCRRRQDFETEPFRRQTLEITRVGKELENLIARLGEPELAFKSICFHHGSAFEPTRLYTWLRSMSSLGLGAR
jgi:hypothetical protein